MTYLESTYFYELEHESVQELISEFQNKDLTNKEKAIGLYLKVRDGWLYNPYLIAFKKEKYRISNDTFEDWKKLKTKFFKAQATSLPGEICAVKAKIDRNQFDTMFVKK